MSASFTKAHKARRKAHKERSQPAKRKKFGLLEKGVDWKKRRDDFHFKEKRLKALYEKARNRNPDEFYHAMTSSKTKDGEHVASRDGKAFTAEEMAVLRTQDFRYVNLGMAQEKQKIERLKANLPLLADARNDKTKSKGGAALKSNHTVFVDSREEVKEFDEVKFFDTAPELLGRKYNRPKKAALESTVAVTGAVKGKAAQKMAKQRLAGYTEISQRMDRLEKMQKVADQMQMKRNLLGKGRRVKVKGGDKKAPVYRWRKERKK